MGPFNLLASEVTFLLHDKSNSGNNSEYNNKYVINNSNVPFPDST